MALLYTEGFDTYTTIADLNTKGKTVLSSTSASYNALVAGRAGGQAHEFKGNGSVDATLQCNLNDTTSIIGFAFKPVGLAAGANLLTYWGPLNKNLEIGIDGAGNLTAALWTGSAFATSAGAPLVAGVWSYIEIKVTASNSVGAVVMRVNGVTVMNVTNVDTVWGGIELNTLIERNAGGTAAGGAWDDLYICDPSGAVNNDFLGDSRIETLLPDGDSSVAWTRSAGTTNYENVDETLNTDDADYVSSSTLNQKDLYTYPALTGQVGTVHGVVAQPLVRKESAGTRTIASKASLSATEVGTTSRGLGSGAYIYSTGIFETRPTGGAWTEADVNASLFGIEITN